MGANYLDIKDKEDGLNKSCVTESSIATKGVEVF